MKVQELMTNDVCVCGPETNLAEAAVLMWGYDCGILPVVADDGKVIGAITDRDICMAVATRNQLASEIKVSEVMSGAIHACRAADDVKQALKVMEREQVRRLPIVNNDGKLQGILSIRDIVLRAEDGHGKRHSELSHEDTVGALKAICADRRPGASHRSSRKSAATQA
jgi:CBS domain-containing protein